LGVTKNFKPSLPEKLRLPAMTLAAHAYEHKRASGIMSDQTAERWFAQLSQQYENGPLPNVELTNGIIVRSMVIDYALLNFVAIHQRVAVIDLGCGFSTRKYRLDINRAAVNSWVNVDLPVVLQARLALQPGDLGMAMGLDLSGDIRSLELSTFDVMETTVVNYLFLLEGVLNHLAKEHAKALLRQLHERYRGGRVIGTVVTANGLKGAQSLAADLGLSEAMWAIEDAADLANALAPVKPYRVWLLGKVASRIGLIRPVTGDEASGLVFMAAL
jgi:O-methyltransferase involved in polyketide biosynthesis